MRHPTEWRRLKVEKDSQGHRVEPDIVVDDLPHATFEGSDAQLDAALKLLQEEIRKDPRPVPKAPPYPNKAFKYGD